MRDSRTSLVWMTGLVPAAAAVFWLRLGWLIGLAALCVLALVLWALVEEA